jgi:flagellar protein FlaI
MFEKVKGLRGILYKKMVEKKPIEEELIPGFSMQKTQRIVEFPKIDDLTKVNITYPLMEPFAYANIKWDNENKELMYIVLEPKLTEEEQKILKNISDGMIELVEVELSAVKDTSKAIDYLEKNILKVIKEFGLQLTQQQFIKLMYYVYRNFIGFNEIEPLLQDPNIEDVSCDGVDVPIYVIHRKFGSLKTNIIFKNFDYLRQYVIKLSERTGRYVSYAEPILAGTLPDGSRVSATLAGDVATRGPVFTIRKFSEKPFSPVDQLELKTADPEILAYFWYMMEHGISLLIVGGVATGKTSLLNTLCMFIPPEAKIVSIEDTRELKIPNEHWIPSLARVGFGIPTPTGEKYGEVTLFDLLKESFRQNPDYVIVGEVRGAEAYVMFQGMSSGHPSISTFHAGSVDTLIKRLTTAPIDLSISLIESLDVVIVMIHAKEKGKSARRIREVVEIESVDPKTDEVKTRTIFKWDPVTDTYKKVSESIKVEKVTFAKGGTMEHAKKEIERRKRIIEWLKFKNIRDYAEVTKLINLYYKEPRKLMEMIGEEFEEAPKEKSFVKPEQKVAVEVPRERKEKKGGRISLLSLLGLKFLKEKS